VELMTKPLNLDRLRTAIREELSRQARYRRQRRRMCRLRRLARSINSERKNLHRQLDTTCAELATAYQTLSGQLSFQQTVIGYQRELLKARNDDDVFRSLFRLFVRQSGPCFGVAMVCDDQAELRIAGRFGVPKPDGIRFCDALCKPAIDAVLRSPGCTLIDAGEKTELFDPPIRRYLVGVSILAAPLIPHAGEMIGLAVLYRKGEQPFTDRDVALAHIASYPTALAVRRND